MSLSLSSLLIATVMTASRSIGSVSTDQTISDCLAHLRSGSGFHSTVVKKVYSGQLESTNESKGEIFFASGKLRLFFTTPEKSLLVYDGKTAWQETEFDDGTDKRAIVTKIQASHLKKDSALLAMVLGDKNIMTEYHVTKNDGEHFELKPNDKKNAEVMLLKLEIHDKSLKRISYIDSLENEVSFSFSDLKEEKIPAKKFRYKPPKGAEVSEM